tara:strand:- start:5807 stop:6277 length:471 start_codon:yes stop_codon:yes gene_type:complete
VKKYIVLENIRSAYNVGAIFRTADASGVSKVFLVGYTPSPIDRFGRIQTEISKTSLGASEEVTWQYFEKIEDVLHEMQSEGINVVAVEQTESSVSLADFDEPEQVVYVMGNEIDGVSDEVLNVADTIVEIPMLGTKESLNVSVAAGIILYHGLTTK